jgi:hypothetical protein
MLTSCRWGGREKELQANPGLAVDAAKAKAVEVKDKVKEIVK